MCHFVSFLMSDNGKVYGGNLFSHGGIEYFNPRMPKGTCEVEWLDDGRVEVRVDVRVEVINDNGWIVEDTTRKEALKSLLLSNYSTREDLLKKLAKKPLSLTEEEWQEIYKKQGISSPFASVKTNTAGIKHFDTLVDLGFDPYQKNIYNNGRWVNIFSKVKSWQRRYSREELYEFEKAFINHVLAWKKAHPEKVQPPHGTVKE